MSKSGPRTILCRFNSCRKEGKIEKVGLRSHPSREFERMGRREEFTRASSGYGDGGATSSPPMGIKERETGQGRVGANDIQPRTGRKKALLPERSKRKEHRGHSGETTGGKRRKIAQDALKPSRFLNATEDPGGQRLA